MSHFTVMVIGPNPEKQLQPYHEYECTGIEDEYVIDVDKTQEIEDELAKEIYVGIDKETKKLDYQFSEESATKSLVSFEKVPRATYLERAGITVDEYVEDEYGYEKKEGKWFRKTNPNKKWDWYQLGGRWSGFLLRKDGRRVDSALKKDIDFEGMASRAKTKAIDQYNDLAKRLGGEIPRIDILWNQMLADESFASIDARRDAYWAQPALAKMKELKIDSFHTDLEDYQCTVEEFGNRAADKSIATYALVIDSKWYAKGEMGWFGMSSDAVEQSDWNAKVREMIDGIPDDTLISIYDCHI